MTDEQWLWLFANEAIDADEKFESLCPSCQHDVTSSPKCIRCGKPISKRAVADFINPNFDADRFDQLNGTADSDYQYDEDDGIDYDRIDELIHHTEE